MDWDSRELVLSIRIHRYVMNSDSGSQSRRFSWSKAFRNHCVGNSRVREEICKACRRMGRSGSAALSSGKHHTGATDLFGSLRQFDVGLE
jgi:hypothetical protein